MPPPRETTQARRRRFAAWALGAAVPALLVLAAYALLRPQRDYPPPAPPGLALHDGWLRVSYDSSRIDRDDPWIPLAPAPLPWDGRGETARDTFSGPP